MGLFDERLLIDGKRADSRIEDRLRSAKLVRTMDGASSLVLAVSDPGWELLRSGVLTQPGLKRDKLTQASWSRFGRARLTLDGARFRLAGAEGDQDEDGQQLTLTFEDEVWSLLRQHKGPMKAARANQNGNGGVTRAQFVARMVREVHPRPAYVIPEFSEPQRIKGNLPKQRRERREKGLAPGSHLTAKGQRLDEGQKRVVERVLTVADEERAGERATLALLVACIQEPDRPFNNPNLGHSSSVGILQLLDIHLNGSTSTNGGRRDIELVCKLFLTKGFTGNGSAIDIAADEPSLTPGQVAALVQGNLRGAQDYTPWETEAEEILAAWGGAGRVQVRSKKYEFRRLGGRRGEEDETSPECIRRLADEVRWRAWADENIFHLVTDPWLFQNRPVTTIRPDTPGLAGFRFTADVGIPVAEIGLKARTSRWDGAPGDCVALDEFGGLDGRWLTWELEHDLLTEDTGITLRRPKPPLPEPAPDREKITLSEPARLQRGSPRERVVQLAKRSLTTNSGFNRYSQPGAFTDDPTPAAPARTDCSQWVHAIYVKAGLPSPGANTWEQEAKSKRTNDPLPGDLLLMDGHVELYIGDGKCIGHGSPPIDYSDVSDWKSRSPHFGTFDFLDG
jgi:hypothetical protein